MAQAKLTAAEQQALTYYWGNIVDAAGQYNVPTDVLSSVLLNESHLNPAAVNHDSNGSQDVGIAQLNSAYYASSVATNPTQSIYTAANILSTHYNQCGSWAGAIQAYNLGHCGSDPGYLAGVQSFQQALSNLPQFPQVQLTNIGTTPAGASTTATGTGFFGWLHQYAWVLIIPGAAMIWYGFKLLVGGQGK